MAGKSKKGKTANPVKNWEIRKVRFDEVKEMGGNPRTISDKAAKGLAASINKFGFVEPLVWNVRTGRIVSGHQRFKALKAAGATEAEMVVVDFDDTDELAASITLNNPYVEGVWDENLASQLLSSLESDTDAFAALNLDDLKESLDKAIRSAVPKQEKNWDTECPCCGYKWKIESGDVSVEVV